MYVTYVPNVCAVFVEGNVQLVSNGHLGIWEKKNQQI